MITCKELIAKVCRLLNEEEADSLPLIGKDTRCISQTVEELLPLAVNYVQRNKSDGELNPLILTGGELNFSVISEEGYVEIVCPLNYVTLISVNLNDWKKTVVNTYPADSHIAKSQLNPYTRTTLTNPLCVETYSNDGLKSIRCYPVSDGEVDITHFKYEAVFKNGDNLCDENMELIDAVVYHCAALVYVTFDKHDSATSMLNLSSILYKKKEEINK